MYYKIIAQLSCNSEMSTSETNSNFVRNLLLMFNAEKAGAIKKGSFEAFQMPENKKVDFYAVFAPYLMEKYNIKYSNE
jgi:hypothetical protein